MSMLTRGVELIMPAPHFDPLLALKAMESREISMCIGVPTMYVGNGKIDCPQYGLLKGHFLPRMELLVKPKIF